MAGLARSFLHFQLHDPWRVLRIGAHFIAARDFLNAETPVVCLVFGLEIQNDFFDFRRLDAPQNFFDFRNGDRFSAREDKGLHDSLGGFLIHLKGLIQFFHFHAESGDKSFLGEFREHFLFQFLAQFLQFLLLFFFF